MNESQNKTGPESQFADWMKTITESCLSMASMWANAARSAGMTTPSQKDVKKSRVLESWQTTQKTWKALFAILSEPDTIQAFFKGNSVLPEILVNMAQTGLFALINLQQQWLEKAEKVGKSTKAFTFENLDEDFLKSWKDIYEKEVRKFFNIPQLGLARLYQEKMFWAVDKFNLYQATVAEFIRLLYLPVEKSFQAMQEKLTEMADGGELPEDSKTYYQMWIKILEGHYMKLLQSPEYTQLMHKTLNSLSEVSVAKKEILQDAMKMLPVPTQKEMDELYKEIYELKKKIKTLEKAKK